MLHNLSNRIAKYFYSIKIFQDEEDIDVYTYGLELLFSTTASFIAVLIIGLIFNQFFAAIAFLFSFIPIRTFSGGYHAETHLRCFLILLAVYSLNILILLYLPKIIMLETTAFNSLVSVFIIYFLSPIEDKNKPISVTEKKKYRKMSLIIALIQLLIVSILLFLGYTSSILLSFTYGQLAATLSLIAAKIKKTKDDKNEKDQLCTRQM